MLKPIFTLILFFILFAFDLFSQAPDSWRQRASLPAAPRQGAVAFVIHDVGFVGTGEDSTGMLLNDFWQYDPVADAWTQVADFSGTARKNAVAFTTGDFGYVGTGIDSASFRKNFYKYDVTLNSWSAVDDLDTVNGNGYGRRDAASFTLQNRGYVVGGYDGTSLYTKTTWEYDENRDTAWQKKTDFPTAGRRWATGFSISGSGFTGLGYNYAQQLNNDLWKYDPVFNIWTQMADYPGTLRSYAVGFVIGNRGYVGSGYDGNLKNDFYYYAYPNNSWHPVAELPSSPTSGAVAFCINGKGYFFGGSDTAGCKNELWEYTPDSIVGIGDMEPQVSTWIIFPNPANNVLNVATSDKVNPKYHFSLYHSDGKKLIDHQIRSSKCEMDIRNLDAGVYYYVVSSTSLKEETQTGKLIIR